MKILRLAAENVKRLVAVEIAPDGSPVMVIAGENAAGKSSVLDAIAMALGGKDLCPAEPIRKGQKKATVSVTIGTPGDIQYVVTRTFLASGGGTLAVTNKDGLKYPSPQALLDGLVGTLAFDPLDFERQDPKDQEATLRALAKVDTTDLDLERKRVFDERTLVNRDVSQMAGAFTGAPHHPDAGTTYADGNALTAELAEADVKAQAASLADTSHRMASQQVTTAEATVTRLRKDITDLEAKLTAAKKAADAADEVAVKARKAEQAAEKASRTAQAALPDRAALRARLLALQADNQKVEQNIQRGKLETDLHAKEAESEALTTRINQIDTQKAEQLAAAAFPLEGLGLSDGGVTWQGLPFEQASTAERLRVSVAIGAALSRTLKIMLIREGGNDLDAKSLTLLADLAAEHGLQCWLEKIDAKSGLPTVVISEGEVQ